MAPVQPEEFSWWGAWRAAPADLCLEGAVSVWVLDHSLFYCTFLS